MSVCLFLFEFVSCVHDPSPTHNLLPSCSIIPTPQEGLTVLMHVASNSDKYDLLSFLIENGVDIHAVSVSI